ncbi:MAG: DUF2955 domain-containing protein [Planctomycetota bacterium]|nr:DUF2955 domain-containing protein [Planctomycetota bacterium]
MSDMDIRVRRTFRLSMVTALSLASAYAFKLQLPYLVPMFAILLTINPVAPPGLGKSFALLVAIGATLTSGMVLIPWLEFYPFAAILMVALGMYASFYLSVIRGKHIAGHFLATGIALVSIAGSVSSMLATLVIETFVVGVAVVILCQWLVYPFFPEDPVSSSSKKDSKEVDLLSNWKALRGTLIVMPSYFMVLINPGLYLPLVLKSIALGQQSTLIDVKSAGREMLGATILGGGFAVLFWWLLGLAVNLWMFFLWALLFFTYFGSKIYGISKSRFPASFWQSVTSNLIILLGAAVMDSENGNDVYQAFVTRISLFIVVALYAWFAVYILDFFYGNNNANKKRMESAPC